VLTAHRILSPPVIDITDLEIMDKLEEESSNEWIVTAGVFTYVERIYIPKDNLLPTKLSSCFHDNPESSHS
jgi:hypothetical protein